MPADCRMPLGLMVPLATFSSNHEHHIENKKCSECEQAYYQAYLKTRREEDGVNGGVSFFYRDSVEGVVDFYWVDGFFIGGKCPTGNSGHW